MSTFDALLNAGAPVLLDGGLSTQLEVMGYQLHDPLWTARALLDDPTSVVAAHRAFIDAGAKILITASYQISRAGFINVGLTQDDADRALVASVDAARTAALGTDVLIAASIGPYGAISADGAEYRGNYGLTRSELSAFHLERIKILADSGADLLAVETIPDLLEAEAIADVLPMDLPAWVCFTAADASQVRAGQRIEDVAAAVAQHPAVRAIGINCTEPEFVTPLLQKIRTVTSLPLIAYPNVGGSWDSVTSSWIGKRHDLAGLVQEWSTMGAVFIGGCCGSSAADISRIGSALSTTRQD